MYTRHLKRTPYLNNETYEIQKERGKKDDG